MVRLRLCMLFLCSACAHTADAGVSAPTLTSADRGAACILPRGQPSAELIRRQGTVLDPYQLEGGVWLEHAPVVLNEDFDFALAMGMEGGVGAGLAAARRKENNTRKAESFSARELAPALRARLEELRCCGVHVYFVLWGAESAALRTVIDISGDTAQSRVVEGAARPLAGEDGWTRGATLLDEARRSLASVACPQPDGSDNPLRAARAFE